MIAAIMGVQPHDRFPGKIAVLVTERGGKRCVA
jgi:hypothetical protein